MAELIWTRPALDDLNEIAEYIALDNPDAARRLIQKIFASVGTLKQFPESGRRPPELKNTQYRELITNPCRIFYRRDGNIVFVLFVMRCEREFRRYLLDQRKKSTR